LGDFNMNDDRGVLRGISWRDFCPWLLLFRAFAPAIGLRPLLLASVAVVAVSAGWRASEYAYRGLAGQWPKDDAEFKAAIEPLERWPGHRSADYFDEDASATASWCPYITMQPREPILHVWHSISNPVRNLFDGNLGIEKIAYYSVGSLWTLLVWALFGGAITRCAAVQLAREERVGLTESVKFAQGKLGSYFGAAVLPLVGVCLVALPIILLAWLMWLLGGVGVWGGGLLWGFVLLGTFIMAVLLLGLLFGWPLMWTTISSEGSDAFDALSRSYAYTFQRPLHYAFYAVVAVFIGALGCAVV